MASPPGDDKDASLSATDNPPPNLSLTSPATNDNPLIVITASSRVFNTFELCEEILAHLSPLELFCVWATCHKFRDIIQSSTILQTKLFLRPAVSGKLSLDEWRKIREHSTASELADRIHGQLVIDTALSKLASANPFYVNPLIFYPACIKEYVDWWTYQPELHHHFRAASRQGFKKLPVDSVHRSMYVTQPPVSEIRITTMCSGQKKEWIVLNQMGVTYGDVCETAVSVSRTLPDNTYVALHGMEASGRWIVEAEDIIRAGKQPALPAVGTNHNPLIVTTAVSRVFNTTELCEKILAHLRPLPLLRASATCHKLRNVIKGPDILQTVLFLKAAPKELWAYDKKNGIVYYGDKAAEFIHRFPSSSIVSLKDPDIYVFSPALLNPLLFEVKEWDILRGCIDHISLSDSKSNWIRLEMFRSWSGPIGGMESQKPLLCCSMFLTQPPVTRIDVFLYDPSKSEWDCSYTTKMVRVRAQGGVTYQDVCKAVEVELAVRVNHNLKIKDIFAVGDRVVTLVELIEVEERGILGGCQTRGF
ncbi:hypothetical protein MBLNU230_g5225t1 [Neophaeotheca triangularis]